MSSDQRLATADGTASAGLARDDVVVPLRAPSSIGAPVSALGRPVAAPGARSVVAQIADYLSRTGRPPAADRGALRAALRTAARPHVPAPPPAAVIAHADELDWLLRQHIDSHLALIAAHAPDLAQPVDNVRRSVELLLKLRHR